MRPRLTRLPHTIPVYGKTIGLASLAVLLAVGCAGCGASRARRGLLSLSVRGGQCAPAVLNASAALPGTGLRVSPLPRSLDASPTTQISLLGRPKASLGAIHVTGSSSGAHPGHLIAYSQGDGASFVPNAPFQPGEQVTVNGRIRAPGISRPFAYVFAVAHEDVLSQTTFGRQPAGGPRDVQAFRSRADLRPPAVSVTKRIATPGGYLFAAPYSGPGQDGPMILDGSGHVVWFKPLPADTEATNFRVQTFEGQQVLTWWQGLISTNHGYGLGEDVIVDRSYRDIDIVRAGNGYQADLHDFQLAGDGTAKLPVYHSVRCDLTPFGGPRNSAVTDGVFQVIDARTGLVRSEWHSLDHIALDESHATAAGATNAYPWDFFHINSIGTERNGSLLISARNTWATYDLDPTTGRVNWRLGGKRSSFTMGPGTRTAYQHDPRQLSDGTISIFDNGATPQVETQSRAIVVRLDTTRMTATLVRQYVHPGGLSAGSQGNVQTLAGGRAFVGWGSQPYFTEFSPNGRVVFDAHLPAAEQSYRVLSEAWTGKPTELPSVAAHASRGGLSVYASWNGATQVRSWKLLGGDRPDRLTPVTVAPRQDFETTIRTASRPAYVEVEALDAAGHVLASSGPVSA